MIQRLVSSLHAIAVGGSPAGLTLPAGLLADCADAIRLELDCPQQTLHDSERESLMTLLEMLDANEPDGALLADAAHRARIACGLAVQRS